MTTKKFDSKDIVTGYTSLPKEDLPLFIYSNLTKGYEMERVTTQNGENNPFHRIPAEMTYKIFARLDAKHIASSRAVCKDWDEMLKPSTLQILSVSTCPAFLVRFSYPTSEKGEDLYVSVDHDGRCRFLNNNAPVVNNELVSCNGLLVYFPQGLRKYNDFQNKIVVCNPSLRWVDIVYASLGRWRGIRGAYYDPSTSHYTLLVGIDEPSNTYPRYKIKVYSSQSREWTSIIQDIPRDFLPQNITALYSQGWFFWMDSCCNIKKSKGIVGCNLSDKKMYRIPLPGCPLHPHKKKFCHDHLNRPGAPTAPNIWQLKGCDGNVVLVHHQSQEYHFAWRLVITEEEGQENMWEWQLPSYAPPLKDCCDGTYFDTNKSGWWLSINQKYDKEDTDEERVIITDEHGNVKQSFPLLHLMSQVGILSHPYVAGVSAYEASNLWDMVASS